MRRRLLAAAAILVATAGVARADALADNRAAVQGCIMAAADAHGVPPVMLVVLLHVEGGSLGRTSSNTNATVDIGPMQVNQIWIPEIAAHWRATQAATYAALRDDFCANLEAGAWILRRGLDEARGDFWKGVAIYHSHAPEHQETYLRQVLKQVIRLQSLGRRALPSQPATRLPEVSRPSTLALD